MKSEIEQILATAVRAPSGDNCQPWRFVVSNETVDIFNIPERDTSLYSWGQRASYVAHGALIENVVLEASAYSCRARTILFPHEEDLTHVARIIFEHDSGIHEDLLRKLIVERATNRKPYKTLPLTTDQREAILQAVKDYSSRLTLVEDPEKRKAIARAASMNEQIVFEQPDLHKFLFEHINWTEEEDIQRQTGFSLDTFELPPPAVFMFKLARRWVRLARLNKIGFSKLIGAANAKIYSSSSALGAIIIPDHTPEQYINCGRMLERVWLQATSMNMSMQLMMGIPFLMLRITEGDSDPLSPQHIGYIQRAYERMCEVFDVKQGILAVVFRIGDGGQPSARTRRLPPQIVRI